MNTEITSSKTHLPLFTRFIINDNETNSIVQRMKQFSDPTIKVVCWQIALDAARIAAPVNVIFFIYSNMKKNELT